MICIYFRIYIWRNW